MRKVAVVISFFIGVVFVVWPFFKSDLGDVSAIFKHLPVQTGGRIQPFDSFAQNSLRDIYGKTSFNNRSAVEVLLSWMLVPDYWNQLDFVRVESSVLKKALKLDSHKNFFSPFELLSNKNFMRELDELKVREDRKESLSGYFQHLSRLKHSLSLYQMVQSGEIPKWFPPLIKKDQIKYRRSNWLSLVEQAHIIKQKKPSLSSNNDYKNQLAMYQTFQKMISAYIFFVSTEMNPLKKDQLTDKPLKTNQLKQKYQNLKLAFQNFKQLAIRNNSFYAKSLSDITWEVHYNRLHPFRWAWVCYLLGLLGVFFLFFVFCIKELLTNKIAITPLVFLIGGFLWHSYGIFLRSIIMLRPPVTNMYETVIWVPWVSVILGSVLCWQKKFFSAFICACVLAWFCLLLTDVVDPNLLDGQFQPLSAVLNSNFWLTTHVLVITMSYAAFFLAFVLGDCVLFLFFRGEKTHQVLITKYIQVIDRSIQVGVVLLFVGTVLGGIWADYSWGRFWGWDPKETWALISLLGYLALLHGRLANWIKEFGMAVGSVLIFFLIVMAWYGVNYVLGQGLHSYGFGSGGIEYVATFVLLHLVYVIGVWTFRRSLN